MDRTRNAVYMLPIFIGILAAFLWGGPSRQEELMQQEIASDILRFHILANSDSPKDQEEKMRAKEKVIETLQPILKNAHSKEETKYLIQENIELIEETVSESTGQKSVRAAVTSDWFPEKQYGEYTFPAGKYEALRIEIGKGVGHNWWCVLYPGLCFSDAVKPVFPDESKEKLAVLFDDDIYDFLLHPAETKIRLRWF